MTVETIKTTSFNFSNLDIKERYDIWRESIAVIFEFDSKSKIPPEVFNAELTTRHFSSILLNTTKTQGQYFNRSQKLIAQDGMDHCWLQMLVKGSTSIQIGSKGANLKLYEGDIFLIDFSQPFHLLTSNFEDINLIIPRDVIKKHLPNIEKYHGAILPASTGFAKILGSHLTMLKQLAHTITTAEAGIIAEGVAHLAGFYFSQKFIPKDDYSIHIATQEGIRCYILSNLGNPNLSPLTIAQHFKMSRAYLYRMFPEKGISAYIHEQRLKKAYRELSRNGSARSISEIAFDLGFNSESHFSRSFRKLFQLSPTEARQNKIYPKEYANQNKQKQLENFYFEEWLRNL
jgi:AraC-like DNA-binding protein